MLDISAKEMKGHNILAVERFQDKPRHMIEFLVKSDNSPYGAQYDEVRLFLDEPDFADAIPELKELLSLMRYAGNNLNQLTRRVHETGRIYDADLEDILQKQDALLDGVKKILTQLGNLA